MLKAIQYIEIPDEFELVENNFPPIGSAIELTYRHKRRPAVEIVLFYRGTRIAASRAADFRSLVQQTQIIFDHSSNGQQAVSQFHLQAVLGNIGNNQTINHGIGSAGPSFFLEKLQVQLINGKHVLAAEGFFHESDGDPNMYFCGIFFDCDPTDSEYCRVEEVLFQAPDLNLFQRHRPDFDKTLSSIQWAEELSASD